MDIANLGVGINPTKAVEGSRRVQAELRAMGETAKKELGKLDQAAEKNAGSVKTMASHTRRGFGDMLNGIADVGNAFGLMNGPIGNLLNRMQSGFQVFARLRPAAAGLSTSLAEVGAAGETAGAGATAAGIGIGSIAAIAAGVLAVLAALTIALGGLAVVYKAFSTGIPIAAKFEQDAVAMETLTGSAAVASRVMKELADLGAKTPLETPELMTASRSLLAFGESADMVTKTLSRVGDVSTAVQAPINEIAQIYGKARVQGTLFAEDINQLTGRGIPIIQEFAKQLHVSTSEVKKLASDGKITFTNLEQAFVSLTSKGGRFFGMMEKQSQTFNGKLSTLRDGWNAMLRDMSAPVMDALKPVIDKLITAVQGMTPAAVAFGETIALGLRALLAAIQGGQITELLGLAIKAGLEFGAANMVTLFQLQIMGLVQLIIGMATQTISFLANLWSSIFTAATTTITQLIQGDWQGAMGTVGEFFRNIFTGGSGIIGNIGQSIINTLGEAFEKVVNVFIQAFYKAWGAVTGMINAGLAKIDQAAGMVGWSMNSRLANPTAPGNIDLFTPKPVTFGDIRAASNNFVGTGARDEFAAKVNALGWQPEFAGPPAPAPTMPKPEPPPSAGGTGGGGGAAKPVDITAGAPKAKELTSELDKLMKEWGDFGKQIDQTAVGIANSIASNFTTAIVGLVDGTKSAKQAFGEMTAAILNDIMSLIIRMTVYAAISRAFGPAGEAFNVAVASMGRATAHTGGEVGRTNLSTPTYHSGGILSSEAMVKVDRGETILTRRGSADLRRELKTARGTKQDRPSQQTATIVNVFDRNEIADVVARSPGAVINAISRNIPSVRKMILSGQRT